MDPARIVALLLFTTTCLGAEEQVLINPPQAGPVEEPTEAEEPEVPTEEELEEQRATGYLRCWVLLSDEQAPLKVQVHQPGLPEPIILYEGTPSKPARAGYQLLKKGPARIEIERNGEPWEKLDAELEPQTFQTLLLMEGGASPKVELLSDHPPADLAGQSQVRIFNVGSDRMVLMEFPDGSRVEVAPETYATRFLPGSDSIPIRVVVPDDNGYPAISHSEISPSAARSWSVFVAPDYRGRFRPRVSPDQLR